MSLRKPISWILNFTANLPNDKEKVLCLRANEQPAVLTILRYCYDPAIKWLMPDGIPPYQPARESNATMLYSEARRLYLFVEGGKPDLNQDRREQLFIELLQSVLPADAELLLSIKDKKMPYEGLDADLVLQAFPGLW